MWAFAPLIKRRLADQTRLRQLGSFVRQYKRASGKHRPQAHPIVRTPQTAVTATITMRV
jgi:hypothetical protein